MLCDFRYYNLDAYYQHKMLKDMKKGHKKILAGERTVFDDEEQRRYFLLFFLFPFEGLIFGNFVHLVVEHG